MAKMKQQILLSLLIVILCAGCGSNKFLVGKKHYQQGEYFKAIENIREVYTKLKSKEEKAEAVYMLGKSYKALGEYNKASPWFKNATRYKFAADNLYVDFAEVQKAAGKLDESAEVYGKILENDSKSKQARFGLKGIEATKNWVENPSLYQVEKMSRLNSNGHERSISILANRSLMISSSRDGTTGKTINPVDGQGYADLFTADYDPAYQKWSFPKLLDESDLNTEADENHVHVSVDGNKLVLAKTNVESGKNHQLFYSLKNGDQWGSLQAVSFTKDGFDYPQASWSEDGRWLYFSSNRTGGNGGFDIWKAQMNEPGSFDEPINLGTQINTKGDELYPVERRSGILYFSSNYHMGAGAQDIFRARKERGCWQITNMGMPVNSHADDFGIQFLGNKEKGFFISNRKGSRKLDVYSFFLPPKLFMCFGKVFNEETDSVIQNVNIRVAGTDGSIHKLVTSNGEFQVELLPDNEYTLIAYKKGFLNAQSKISTKGLNEAQEFQVEFKQTPTDNPIRLEQIYYETGKWELLTSSKKSLDELVNILQINPNIQIEVSAHTDEVGAEAFNLELSQKRANEVVRYLIEKGISAKRLIAKGYGEKKPFIVNAKVAKNIEFLEREAMLSPKFISSLDEAQQEIAKSLNRRTEFEVIGD